MSSRDVGSAGRAARGASDGSERDDFHQALAAPVAGKHTRSGEAGSAGLMSAMPAASGGASVQLSAQQRAGDWSMSSDLSSAMGLGARARGALQLHADAAAASSPAERPSGEAAQQIAQRGVAGASSALPFAAEIARSFGRHDISDVRTATGGAATEASGALGAHAYATGDTIGFAQTPDLHLAAHEAAHVVQQRAGVHLADGLGRPGDLYEQHADAVADAVVRGDSAEALLDQHAGQAGFASSGGNLQRAVQRFEALPSSDEPAIADPAWSRFAEAFRAGFPADVLSLFGGESVTGARLRPLFTAEQRDKISAFLAGNQIPDRLFNGGGAMAGASARQRILVSSHILTTGTYENPEHEQQRVEARNCGHFVTLINAYAGVGSANGLDVRGNVDHTGDIVLFGGGTNRPSHATSAGNLPLERFDEIQPGDWLYIQGVVNHSVVFSQWTDETSRSISHLGESYAYRRAITYDQLHNGIGEGGLRHTNVALGPRALRRADGARMEIYPITRVEPPQETSVATTAADLLPAGADLTGAAERNRAGLERSGLTLEDAITWVRDQNTTLIATVSAPRTGGLGDSRCSPEQLALLQAANAEATLEPLVHLNERLQRLADAVAFLERSEDADAPHRYSSDRDPVERRAASGFFTSSGRGRGPGGVKYDVSGEAETTGLLEKVRQKFAGYRPGAAPRGRRQPAR